VPHKHRRFGRRIAAIEDAELAEFLMISAKEAILTNRNRREIALPIMFDDRVGRDFCQISVRLKPSLRASASSIF
jgi:hypothetical protein